MCAVTIETGALAGTTEMAMPWLGVLMRDSGLVVPTGQLLTASFCERQRDSKHNQRNRAQSGQSSYLSRLLIYVYI